MTEAAETQEVTTISLTDICKELDIKPQGARVKLRRKMKEAKGAGFRWVFPLEQKDEIITLLTAKAEKKEAEEAEGEE